MTFKYAPFWKRLVSYLIDIILSNSISLVIFYSIGLPPAMKDWLFFGVFLTYNILMDYRFQGTLGKRILRLKVVRTNGQRPDLKTSFYRNFGKIVSVLPLFWGFIRMLTPSYPQGIHDELARCYVIEK
jgi:uncharacterized RDD family membrane protein YckC